MQRAEAESWSGITVGCAAARRIAGALGPLGAGDESLPDAIAGMRIVRRIGAGGMGEVFEAEQDSPRRRVALKILRPEAPLGAEALLRDEIEMLGRLEHPGIARIYTAGVACIDGVDRPWLAMELIDGHWLTEHVRRRALPLRARARLMRSVCEAVQYAHDMGVAHLDLKPSNVMVDARGEVRILDFGVARLLEGAVAPGMRAGTPRFMSPEQRDGGPIGPRADVFGLGALLGAVIQDGVDGSPGAELRAVLDRATAPDPAARYPSPGAMADDLRRFEELRPVGALPPSLPRSGRLLLRRRRRPLIGAAAALAALMTTAALWRAEAQQRSLSQRSLQESEARASLAEDRAQRESQAARRSAEVAETQATLAKFAADLLETSGEQADFWATTPLQPDPAPPGAATLTIREGTRLDVESMAELIRLQSALASDPADEDLREQARQLAFRMLTGGAIRAADAQGARSGKVEFTFSTNRTETIQIDAPEGRPE